MARRRRGLPAKAQPKDIGVQSARMESAASAGILTTLANHEAASFSRRTATWRAPTTSPNDVLSSLATLRNRSREAIRNNGYAANAINGLTHNIVGTGIQPLPKLDDKTYRTAVTELWNEWVDVSDPTGVLSFYGQQHQAVRTWLAGGEVMIRLRPRLDEDGLPVPLQIEVLEPEFLALEYTGTAPGGNPIRAGIETNFRSQRVAYYFRKSRTGDINDSYESADFVRVDAAYVIHMFSPDRPGQIRGIPKLTPGLMRLRDIDLFTDAALLKQQVSNLFAGFIERGTEPSDDALVDPLNSGPLQTDPSTGAPLADLEPGLIQELDPGTKITWSNPPGAPSDYASFLKQNLMAVAAAVELPYELLTGDMGQISDRTVRVIFNEFRRKVSFWQHEIVAHQMCRVIWNAWLDAAVNAGALPLTYPQYQADLRRYRAVSWMPPAFAYVHPVQDVEAAKARIRAGLSSRQAEIAQLGLDAETVDAEQVADNKRADALGLLYDSDARVDNTPPPAPAPPAGDAGVAPFNPSQGDEQ